MQQAPDNPLRGARFVLAAHEPRQLPKDVGAEIAFAGISNAGKSSALNALVGQAALARTSKTPGRTQQIVVFEFSNGSRLIDLPGYGYAKVPASMREHWRGAIDTYLHRRKSLRGVVLIADVRHALKEYDRQMLRFCADIGLPCIVLLSKTDKLSRAQALAAQGKVQTEIAKIGSSGEKTALHASAILFSATTGTGVEEARAAVVELLRVPEA